MTTVTAVAETKRRSASELARIGSCDGRREQVAEPAHGLDHVDAELLADAADEHLDGVAVAIKVLIVKVLDQFGARDNTPGVMHQVGEQTVFVARQLDRVAVDADASGARV